MYAGQYRRWSMDQNLAAYSRWQGDLELLSGSQEYEGLLLGSYEVVEKYTSFIATRKDWEPFVVEPQSFPAF